MDRQRATDGRLASRLRYLRKTRSGSLHIKKNSGELRNSFVQVSLLKEGWEREGEYLYTREKSAALKGLPVSGVLPPSRLFLRNRGIPVKELLFYDLETTGLSTGAGVIPFLGGVGRVTRNFFVVKQYFLSDFPGEPDFINAFLKNFEPGKVLVSYNGKAFDRNLLISRALLNGLHFPDYNDLPEIDLLYPSRRLWKAHLPDCTLQTIERKVLGTVRDGDIPGRDIPDIYFNFLKTRSTRLVDKVFAHHYQDIYSLASLMGYMLQLLENPFTCRGDRCFSLGRCLIKEENRRYEKSGEELLKRIWRERGRFSPQAGIILSLYHKKAFRFEIAKNIWEEMWKRDEGFFQGVELSKFYEHKRGNYKKALYYTKVLISKTNGGINSLEREKLIHRLNRLERKINQKKR